MDREVQRYFDAVPQERRPLVHALHEMIMGLYPNAQVVMSYKIPTYKAKSGWVALANQKHYVSLYTCGPHHIAELKAKYPAVKTGTGCINLKLTDSVPIAALKKVVKHAIEHPK